MNVETSDMNTHSEKSTSGLECIDLLHQSNKFYQEMGDLLKSMANDSLEKTPEQHQIAYRQFSDLQMRIESHEILVETSLRQVNNRSDQIQTLLNERKSLLEDLLNLNNLLTKRANSIKVMAGEDIRQSRTGHTAIKGYKTQEQVPRKNILQQSI